jgi:hypothetical protein
MHFIIAGRRRAGATAAVKPEGAMEEPEEPEVKEESATVTHLPGVGAGAGSGAGPGAGVPATGQVISLRFKSARNRHWVGTCQGSSSQRHIGQMPVPAIAHVQRPLTPLIPYCANHSKGLFHTLS